MKSMKKKIFLTGGCGYIGSLLIRKLLDLGYIVKCLDLFIYGDSTVKSLSNNKNFILIKGDVREKKILEKHIEDSDIIIHLSDNTSISVAENNTENSLISTVLPIINLINAAKELSSIPRVVFASTATIYGLTEKFPIEESHVSTPITSYDLHKFFAEQQLKMASNDNLIDAVSLRLANVYGPSLNESSAHDRGILSKVTRMSFENKNPQVYGDGNYIRDYIYIDDVVSAFLYASIIDYDEIRRKSEIIFNVSSGIGVSVKNVFSLISSEVEKITGTKLKKTRDNIKDKSYSSIIQT